MTSRNKFRLAFMLALVSGFAALTHELLWTRRLIDLLGASTQSTSRVFGFFFLGLAFGSAAAAGWVNRVKRPWRIVALAETAVAVFALPMFFLPEWSDWIWPTLGMERLMQWPGVTVKTVVSAIAILPPAFCMGLVLPFLSHGLLRWTHRLETDGVRLYAINTLGGAIGLLVAVMYLLPRCGAATSMVCAMALNVAVAVGALVLDRQKATASVPENQSKVALARGQKPFPRSLLLVACFSGTGILAAEIIAHQLFMLVATISFYAPAAILFAVISSLALGAFLAPRLRRRTVGIPFPSLIAGVLAIAALFFALGPLFFMRIVEHMNVLGVNGSVNEFIVKLTALALVTTGPGFLLAGLVFPLTISWAAEAVGDHDGKRFGWLLAINGLGGVLGAETAYRLLLPWFDVHVAMGAVAVAYAVAGLALAFCRERRFWRLRWQAGALAGVALLAIFGLPQLPLVNTHHGLTVLDHRSGREGSVAVVESAAFGRCILMDNQYLLGGSHACAEEERQALLPLLLHPAPHNVAFIGLATGITPGAALLDSNLTSITVVELSPLVEREANAFFSRFNHEIIRNKRANVVIDDGRTLIAAAPGRFDLVVGDLFLPWSPGEGRLYSVEHFRDVRRSLRPGGVFCQWLAMYQFTPRQFEIIADTFQKVFPRTYLFCNAMDSEEPTLALVGFQDDRELDWQRLNARCLALREQGLVNDALLQSADSVAQLYLGQWQNPALEGETVALNTLGNLLIELDAGRERLTGNPGSKYFYGSRWLHFCHDRRTGMAQSQPANSPITVASLELADHRMQEAFLKLRNSQAANRSTPFPPPQINQTKPTAAVVPR